MNISEETIARARRGDGEAFRLIFEWYTRPVISFIFYMVNERGLAEELAQETFLRAYKSIGSLRADERLSAWLFGIARNVARESLRSRRSAPQSVEMGVRRSPPGFTALLSSYRGPVESDFKLNTKQQPKGASGNRLLGR